MHGMGARCGCTRRCAGVPRKRLYPRSRYACIAAVCCDQEISSDGDLSTLDVIFPSAPQPLAFGSGELLQALLEPQVGYYRPSVARASINVASSSLPRAWCTCAPQLYFMADFLPGHPFTQPCSLHSCGKWPVVDAGERPPMSLCGCLLHGPPANSMCSSHVRCA
jgi:hypothetical protein